VRGSIGKPEWTIPALCAMLYAGRARAHGRSVCRGQRQPRPTSFHTPIYCTSARSESGRRMLGAPVGDVDESFHLAHTRGVASVTHAQRLDALGRQAVSRAGPSATHKPCRDVARLPRRHTRLCAPMPSDCTIIDSAPFARLPCAEIPSRASRCGDVREVWTQLYDRLAQLVSELRTDAGVRHPRPHPQTCRAHRAPSVRAPRQQHVTAHHGSMAKGIAALDAELAL